MPEDYFQIIYRRLFDKSSDELSHRPFVTERLVRNTRFQNNYLEWKDSADFTLVMTNLRTAFHFAQEAGGNSPEMGFFIYSSPQASGFYFNRQMNFSGETCVFLLDHFRDIVMTEGYQLYISDRKFNEKPTGIESVERHYLKPEVNRQTEGPIHQMYGNILIELKSLNDRPVYLKLMANIYSDRKYFKAWPFKELVEKLFDQEGA